MTAATVEAGAKDVLAARAVFVADLHAIAVADAQAGVGLSLDHYLAIGSFAGQPLLQSGVTLAGTNRALAGAAGEDGENGVVDAVAAQTLVTRSSQANLAIHVHGDDRPALPSKCRKDKDGRLLRRPQRGQPAAPVADFLTAVPN